MTTWLRLVSYLGLALTLLPSFLVFAGRLSLPTFKTLVLVGTLLWLTTAPLWINREPGETAKEGRR